MLQCSFVKSTMFIKTKCNKILYLVLNPGVFVKTFEITEIESDHEHRPT